MTQGVEAFFVHAAVFLVALLYSSVGHGGASGYLAILSLFSLPQNSAAASALVLNILVSSLAVVAFYRAGRFHWKLTWPFLLGSIPMAYVGGLIRLPPAAFSIILGLSLILAAFRLWLAFPDQAECPPRVVVPVAVILGMAIGLISGMIGIGGGVFLSPLILLLGWADAKQAAATSALFILLNSSAGLLARWQTVPAVAVLWSPLVISAFAGGWLGARIGSTRLSNQSLRRLLSFVLWGASLKLLYGAL
ncbi:MAG: sulfite exporter TauE/SafE family protein [Planctomycetota bacterium]